MKRITSIVLFVFTISFLLIESTVWAQSQIEANPEITILGTSNIHDWEATSNTGKVNWIVVFNSGHINQINDIHVAIPVASIESDKGNKMNRKMHEALKKDKFPTIKFSLDRVEKIEPKNGKGEIHTLGYLEIAGKKQLVELLLNAEKLDDKTIQIKLTKKIKMTDYDIELPSALFGMIKTDDEVTIHIQFLIKMSE
ncbi:MAG: YceI family protein [Flavobacteriaceae bacterium]